MKSLRAIPMTCALLAATLPLAAGAVLAQPSADADDREFSRRVRELSQQLRYSGEDGAEGARDYAALEKVTEQLRNEIDRYVHRAISPSESSERSQARLRDVLSEHRPDPEYGDLPLARVRDLRAGRSLIAAYTIVRPPHHDLPTIRGYAADGETFRLVATAGQDLDEYNMFVRELTSPVHGEGWLLAWGQAHTFNGARFRLRVYAFDGEAFRTVWSPDDLFNVRITLTNGGFTVDHVGVDQPFNVRDEYVLASEGPVRTGSSAFVEE